MSAELASLVRASRACVVLTGAGVSTASGIPDFRGDHGLWTRQDAARVASIEGFYADPRGFYAFWDEHLSGLERAAPNDAHRVVAKLEARGLVHTLITQNVDGLHGRAGSRDVIEVHGTIATATCPACGRRETRERILELLPVPRCDGCGAVLKPDVVMFGELLPVAAIDRATTLAQDAALLVVVGSSLEVWPVAGLPEETLMHGGRLAIVNREETPYDVRAALVLHGSAGEILEACVRTMTSSS